VDRVGERDTYDVAARMELLRSVEVAMSGDRRPHEQQAQ